MNATTVNLRLEYEDAELIAEGLGCDDPMDRITETKDGYDMELTVEECRDVILPKLEMIGCDDLADGIRMAMEDQLS